VEYKNNRSFLQGPYGAAFNRNSLQAAYGA
jgi:hypothetical protein